MLVGSILLYGPEINLDSINNIYVINFIIVPIFYVFFYSCLYYHSLLKFKLFKWYLTIKKNPYTYILQKIYLGFL